MNNKKNKQIQPEGLVEEVIKEIKAQQTDPMGSYTGLPRDVSDKPVQDVDDL